jgi:hypothetical protein
MYAGNAHGVFQCPSEQSYVVPTSGPFKGQRVRRVQRRYYPIQILTSADGLDWHPAPQSNEVFGGPSGLVYGNGHFVAVGLNEYYGDPDFMILSSSNGLNWVASKTTNSLNTICFGSGLFVAISGDNVASSRDGVSWTQRSLPGIQPPLRAIAYDNGHFVAVGSKGTFLQSGPIVSLVLMHNPITRSKSLALEGPTGLACVLQSSSDLISWQNLTNVNAGQAIELIEDSTRLFYRAFSQ